MRPRYLRAAALCELVVSGAAMFVGILFASQGRVLEFIATGGLGAVGVGLSGELFERVSP